MDTTRKPYQGVTNIVRFNWHFYAFALLMTVALFVFRYYAPEKLKLLLTCLGFLSLASCLTSLLASYYIYDKSDLFQLKWLDSISIEKGESIANISAGFDETSALLAAKYPNAVIRQFDFYNPERHTEISIERARKAYPPNPFLVKTATQQLALETNSTDKVLLILAAHEIRNPEERIVFLKEVRRALKENGTVVVTEHLRDIPNFLAFNIGFFHFYSKKNWLKTFEEANFNLIQEIKTTPFISTFILKK
ncbi:class I SAM-dependent methyltransferase [Flavobacterium pedocola]